MLMQKENMKQIIIKKAKINKLSNICRFQKCKKVRQILMRKIVKQIIYVNYINIIYKKAG